MIHQFRDKNKITRRKNIIRSLILAGILLIVIISGLLSWFPKILNTIGRPIWKMQNKLIDTTSSAEYIVRSKSSISNENQNLKIENQDLKNRMVDYTALSNENRELKELMGRITSKDEFILGAILARPNKSPYDSIIIDIGQDHGLYQGQKVFVSGDIPIGFVSEVYSNTSLVALYSNPGQKTEGILDGTNATVELVGRGGGNFEMTIPTDLSVESGKVVLLPGIKREVVAIVDGLISVPTDPAKRVLLRSPINIQSQRWVEVKKN